MSAEGNVALSVLGGRGWSPNSSGTDTNPRPGTLYPARPLVAGKRKESDRREAFETEAMPHLRALYATACRLTRSVPDAEDLVQDTYLRAYRYFDRYTHGTDIRAWLFTILYRARTDTLRRKGRRPTTVSLVGEGPVASLHGESAFLDGDEVARALARVPEVFRRAVVLRDLHDFSYAEVSGILGIPIGTVMSRIHRGRAILRRTLRRGVPEAVA